MAKTGIIQKIFSKIHLAGYSVSRAFWVHQAGGKEARTQKTMRYAEPCEQIC